MYKCTVCGFIYEGEEAPEHCPKCGAPREKFAQVSDDTKAKILRSRFSNDLHMELKSLLDSVLQIAEQGIEDNLDPGCVKVFTEAKDAAVLLGQMVKAELETHMKKEKWG